MHGFCMAAVIFLTGHGKQESMPWGNCTFPNLLHHQNLESMRTHASQALMMHLVGKCAISALSMSSCYTILGNEMDMFLKHVNKGTQELWAPQCLRL